MALTLPFGAKVYVALDFLIHQDQITEDHCININKPMKMCSGKCYLNDQLQQLDGTPHETPSILTISTSYHLFSPTTARLIIKQPKLEKISSDLPYIEDFSPFDISLSIFQPPELTV